MKLSKRQKESFRKVWKTLKTAFKWLLLIIIVFWLLSLLGDFLHHYSLLVDQVNQQGQTIDQLNGQLHLLQDANNGLVHQLQLEHEHVEQLQQQLQLKINGQPVVMTPSDIHNELQGQLITPKPELSNLAPMLPITIVGAMTLMKSLLFKLPIGGM
jgi:hypothetical protein